MVQILGLGILIDDAIESILQKDERKDIFKERNALIQKTYKAILPDRLASEFQPKTKTLQVLADKLESISPPIDISNVMREVSKLLDKSVKVEPRYNKGISVEQSYKSGKIFDLSKIDFDKLQEEFKKGRKRTLAEQLKRSIEMRLNALCLLNNSRMDFMEKFNQLIEEYNAGSMNVEEYYTQLLEFVKKLNAEEKRAISENLTEEELAVYDLLMKPGLHLTQKEILQVKQIAQDLLKKLKAEKFVLDWRKKQQAKAAVKLCIEEMLESLPSSYSNDIYSQECNLIYEHIYNSYYGSGKSIYAIQA